MCLLVGSWLVALVFVMAAATGGVIAWSSRDEIRAHGENVRPRG